MEKEKEKIKYAILEKRDTRYFKTQHFDFLAYSTDSSHMGSKGTTYRVSQEDKSEAGRGPERTTTQNQF